MHSLISIVGVVLLGKENYPEWSRKINTLIFSEFRKGVCVGEGDNEHINPALDKEITIFETNNKNASALIVEFVNEEVCQHYFIIFKWF